MTFDLKKKAEEITKEAFTNHEDFPKIYNQWVALIESALREADEAGRQDTARHLKMDKQGKAHVICPTCRAEGFKEIHLTGRDKP